MAQEIPHFFDNRPSSELAADIVSAMTDEEALGQILMFGYFGEEADAGILEWISEWDLGGVKIFGWNANNLETLAQTVGRYQEKALTSRFEIPILIATDQEGGWVRHIKGRSSETAGNMALGAGRLPYDSLMTGRLLGQELAAIGVNMNFAPTIDIFVDPRADVIGPRAFGADPEWTGILGLSFMKGLSEAGVIATAKHFPGHGGTSEDSHGTLPVVNADLETLRERDLVPYRMLINEGLPAIMVGHLAFPAITNDETPATLSKTILTDLLRNEMGFDGVVVTDDLFMRGARTDGASLPEVCFRAVMAGADILLVSQSPNDHREIHRLLLENMKSNPSFAACVRESAERVITMKAEWLKRPDAVPFYPNPEGLVVPAPNASEFFLGQAARAVTLIADADFPIPPETAGEVLLAGNYNNFFREGLRRFPKAKTWKTLYEPTKAELRQRGEELLRAAREYDTVIVLLPDEEMSILLNELEPISEKVVVISVLSPAHLNDLSWVRTALAVYGTGDDSFKAAFAALAGDFTPEGILPIPLGNEQ